MMNKFSFSTLIVASCLSSAWANGQISSGPYHVLTSARVNGAGRIDYVYVDSSFRKLYIPRSGPSPKIMVFELDTLGPLGELDNTSAHGTAVDPKYAHGFATSKPVAMWDAKSLTPIKTIDVDGRPDGLLGDPYNHRIYIFSHSAPNATVIDAATGTVLGTIDLGGAPEQAATDRKGRIYVDIEDKAQVAVIDANTMKVVADYDLNGKGAGCAGLALDPKNNVLYVACREPNVMVMLDAKTGKYLADLPIGNGCDGVVFNPKTGETFSSQRDGTLTVIKQTGPKKFFVEQTVKTTKGAKTCSLDIKTGKIYLIAPEYAADPAPEVEQPKSARPLPDAFTIWVVGK
jgi:YVTN family beta-propeller protein